MKKSKSPPTTVTFSMESSQSSDTPLSDKARSTSVSSASSRSERNASPVKNLTKNVSKSHDNLASTLRKKAAAAALAGNKDVLDRCNSPKFKTPKAPVTPGLKGNNGHSNSEPIKRAQSAQNISKSNPQSAPKEKSSAWKKSASTHNISQKVSGPVKQRNMNSQHIMAYNAELLASFEKEKKSLERRISELIQVAESRKTEVEKLKFEVKNLKEKIPSENILEEVELLRNENKLLKDKLHELGVSVEHSTDSEKLSALQKKNEEAHSGSEAGCANSVTSNGVIDRGHSEGALSAGDLSFITPEHPSSFDNSYWDRVSQKSGESEVSVACLQDRILQMEETHYSTNEELQATLQELTDLQQAVNDLSDDNERFADEKQVLLESLCAQTMKLENCRMQIDHLKALIMNESEVKGNNRSENEKQLVALLKTAQEEREEFLLKQMELMNNLQHLKQEVRDLKQKINESKCIISSLQQRNESLLKDKQIMDVQLSELKEQAATDQIEIQKSKTLLENTKKKVSELEQAHAATDQTDLEVLLIKTRDEKEMTDARFAKVQEELFVTQNQVSKLKEQMASLGEELRFCKDNALEQITNLTEKITKKDLEKEDALQQVESLRDHIDTLQLDCDRFLDEKKSYSSNIKKLESEIKTVKSRNTELEADVNGLLQKYSKDKEEWHQFQHDLQTAVVIANEIKMESQETMEKLQADQAYHQERTRHLEQELLHAQEELNNFRHQYGDSLRSCDIRGKVISTVDRELAMIRQGTRLPSGDASPCLSVKNLIHSIEQQVKTSNNTPPMSPISPGSMSISSRRNSSDSIISNASHISILSEASPLHHSLDRRSSSVCTGQTRKPPESSTGRAALNLGVPNIIYDSVSDDVKATSPIPVKKEESPVKKTMLTSILKEPIKSALRRSSIEKDKSPEKGISTSMVRQDPLAILAKQMGGSKRNALLKWCQAKTVGYDAIDITNFSSSWNDGLAFCALLSCYLPDKISYYELKTDNQEENFLRAFNAADSVGIPRNLSVSDMVAMERPDWMAVMTYVTSIYRHFEVDKLS